MEVGAIVLEERTVAVAVLDGTLIVVAGRNIVLEIVGVSFDEECTMVVVRVSDLAIDAVNPFDDNDVAAGLEEQRLASQNQSFIYLGKVMENSFGLIMCTGGG